MIDDVDGHCARGDEGDGGDQRTWREPADTADPVATGTAIAKTGPEADQKTGKDQRARRPADANFEDLGREEAKQQTASEKTSDEDRAPEGIILGRTEEAADDAANAGNLAVTEQQHGGTQTNEHASC